MPSYELWILNWDVCYVVSEAEERASTTATAVICQVCFSCCDDTCRTEFVEAYTLRAFVEHVSIAGIGDGGHRTCQFVAFVTAFAPCAIAQSKTSKNIVLIFITVIVWD